tara:strand:- start:1610 stop:2404 length:795 start_codon:yes stop_codon:yes gene_type:complete
MENIQEQTEEQAEPTTLQFGQGQEEGTLSNEQGQVEEVSGWESDKRFSSHWNESPDKMYETLKYNEKRHGEYDKQVKELNTNLESYKQKASDFDTLNTFLEQNGEVQNTILNALEQSKNGTARQQQVGQNQLPNEYAEMLEEVNSLKGWKSSVEDIAEKQYMDSQQKETFQTIDDFAGKFNIQYDKSNFMEAMDKNSVPVEHWLHFFKSQASDVALKNAQNSAAEKAYHNKSITGSMPQGKTMTGSTGSTGMTLRQKLESVLNK